MIYIIYLFALIGFLVVAIAALLWFYNYRERNRAVVYGSCSPCRSCGYNTQDGIPCRYCGY